MIVKYSSGQVSISKKRILNDRKFHVYFGALVQKGCSVLLITEFILED